MIETQRSTLLAEHAARVDAGDSNTRLEVANAMTGRIRRGAALHR
jgi:hypothetical protein